MKKWIRLPGPGQYRGEGDWTEVLATDRMLTDHYAYCAETGFLPTAESDEKPKETVYNESETV